MRGREIVIDNQATGYWVHVLDGWLGRAYCRAMNTVEPPSYELGSLEEIPQRAPILQRIRETGWPEFASLVRVP